MKFSEASNILASLKHQYQAFEHLGEIVALAGSAEQVVKESEIRLYELRDAIDRETKANDAANQTAAKEHAFVLAAREDESAGYTARLAAAEAAALALRAEIEALTRQRDALAGVVAALKREVATA